MNIGVHDEVLDFYFHARGKKLIIMNWDLDLLFAGFENSQQRWQMVSLLLNFMFNKA